MVAISKCIPRGYILLFPTTSEIEPARSNVQPLARAFTKNGHSSWFPAVSWSHATMGRQTMKKLASILLRRFVRKAVLLMTAALYGVGDVGRDRLMRFDLH